MNLDPDEAVVNNPGFAPVYTTGPEVNGYACITGGFNENYQDVHKDDVDENGNKKYHDYYYHEGIDFRGPKGTEIKSLINGKVIDFGTHKNKHNGTGMGDYMIVQDFTDTNKYYLLLHLLLKSWEKYGIIKGSIVSPGMTVAGVGTPDYNVNAYHLHVSVIVLNNGKRQKSYT